MSECFQIGNLSGATTSNIKAHMLPCTLDVNIRGTMVCVRAISMAIAAQETLSYESRRFGTEVRVAATLLI